MSLPTSPDWPSGLQDYTIVRNRRQEPVGLGLMLLRRWESGPNLDLRVIVNKAGKAVHVLDRFHIVAHLSKAIDEVHAQKAKELNEKGFELVLTKTRWPLLNRAENLTDKQETKLSDVLKYNLRSVRSYLLKEEFRLFWSYTSPYWAGQFLDTWCTKVMRSKIDPMKKVAKMLRRHTPLRLNWIRAKNSFPAAL